MKELISWKNAGYLPLLLLVVISTILPPRVYPSSEVVFLFLAISFALIMLPVRRGSALISGGLQAALGIWLTWTGVSLCWNWADGRAELSPALFFASGVLVFVSLTRVGGRDTARRLAAFLGLWGTALSIYGIYQYFFMLPTLAGTLRADPTLSIDFLAAVQHQLRINRLSATLLYPNTMASFLLLVLPVTAGLCWSAPGGWFRRLWLGSLLLQNIALYLTFSVGGWLVFTALVVSVLLAMVFSGRRGIVLPAMLILAVTVLLSSILSRRNLMDFLVSGVSNRLKLFWNTWQAYLARSFIGYGPGGISGAIADRGGGGEGYAEFAHNLPLQLAAELGTMGLVAAVVSLFLLARAIWRARGNVAKDERPLYYGLLAAAGAFLLHNLVDFSWYMPEAQMIFWLVAACALLLGRKGRAGKLLSSPRQVNSLTGSGGRGSRGMGFRNYLPPLLAGLAVFVPPEYAPVYLCLAAVSVVLLVVRDLRGALLPRGGWRMLLLAAWVYLSLRLCVPGTVAAGYSSAVMLLLAGGFFFLGWRMKSGRGGEAYRFSLGVLQVVVVLAGLRAVYQRFFVGEPFASGWERNPNLLAALIILALFTFLPWLSGQVKGRTGALRVLALLVMLVALALTGSRGAGAALVLTLIFYLLARGVERRAVSVVVLMIVLSGGAFFLAGTLKTKISGADKFSYNRFNIYRASIDAIAKRPFVGYGPGGSELALRLNNFPDGQGAVNYDHQPRYAHSEPLTLLLEHGMVGVFLLLGALFFVLCRRGVFRASNAASGICWGLVAVSMHSCVEMVFLSPAVLFWTALLAGVALGSGVSAQARNVKNKGIGLPEILTAVVLGLFLLRPIAASWLVAVAKDGTAERPVLLAAVRANPFEVRALFRLGKLSLAAGEVPLAERYFRRAAAYEARDAYYRVELARLWLARSSLEEGERRERLRWRALAEMDAAILLHPYRAFIYLEKGVSYLGLAELEQAEQAFIRAIDLEPNYLAARYYLAVTLEANGKRQEAESAFAELAAAAEKLQGYQAENEYTKNIIRP